MRPFEALFGAASLGLALAPTVLGSGFAPSELPDLVEKILPGVVNISSTTVMAQLPYGWAEFFQYWGIPAERKQPSLGSGFVIDRDGFVLTNNHVVAEADEVIVTMHDKKTFQAKLIGRDDKMDLALLQLRGEDRRPPADLQPVPLGDSDAVRIAEPVFAVGNPFGLQHTVTAGIISAKHRTIGLGPFDNFLQTDASINPGNSGGPLFNLKGEVIGINAVIFSRTGQSGGLGFAIPVNEAKLILGDLKRYGRVPRPWLGLVGDRLTLQLARYHRLPLEHGVIVYEVVRGTPAHKAGLNRGDILVAIDGQATNEPHEVERILAKKKPKDKVKLRFQSGRKTIEKEVGLQELPRLEGLPQGTL